MAVEIEQGEVFATRHQRFVSIEPLMIHIHDMLVAPVEFTEPIPTLLGWSMYRPDYSSTSLIEELILNPSFGATIVAVKNTSIQIMKSQMAS
jgi:hypothetical protein